MNNEERQQNIDDARAMLDFYEANPDLPFDGITQFQWFYDAKDKPRFFNFVTAFGTFEKVIDEKNNKLRIIRRFGGSKIQVDIPQSVVCRKVTVVKEVEEYQCDPLLSAAEMLELESATV